MSITPGGSDGSGKQDAGLIVNVGDAFGDEASWCQIRGRNLALIRLIPLKPAKQHRYNGIKTERLRL
ncbi:hypothetical protein OIU34_08695 [Pararhizobium sp. BT-229]|uniref:hypothetical protein n=1 Tax=Pararhizobium sp. BT-229 TaxID=2986923 RepID=UPI0021F7A440|nr:hypothetical protein [Pararhizobium sp. BT-229]MCV9961977.1 hypothetical protein [Pararhizobium sp. BT-229]